MLKSFQGESAMGETYIDQMNRILTEKRATLVV